MAPVECSPCTTRSRTAAIHGTASKGKSSTTERPTSDASRLKHPDPSEGTATIIAASTEPYGHNFQQHLIGEGIFPFGEKRPDGTEVPEPKNRAEIQQRLCLKRRSISPSGLTESKFKEFCTAAATASTEELVTQKVMPTFEKATKNKDRIYKEVLFDNLRPILRGTRQIGRPGIYHGSRPGELAAVVRDDLSSTIVPSTSITRPLAPNFFAEAKSPDESMQTTKTQLSFIGALGTRALHSLQTYGQKVPIFDRNAQTISCSYNDGSLKIFAHHCEQPYGPDTRPEYYMNEVGAYAVTGSLENLVQGITAYRNAQDWAEVQRKKVIAYANGVAAAHDAGTEVVEEELAGCHHEDDPMSEDLTVSSSTSQSSSADRYNFRRGRSRRYEAGSSSDELAMNSEPVSPKRRKRDRAPSGGLSRAEPGRTSTAVTACNYWWTWARGTFKHFDGNKLLHTQSNVPPDVWVFLEPGWPDGNGVQWRYYSSISGQMLYYEGR